MKISYDRESDILLIDQGEEGDVIDYAEQPLIIKEGIDEN